ncbi:MAG: hypothetical protein AAFQ40_03925 [Cyanobacteria bacterium J06623_5]
MVSFSSFFDTTTDMDATGMDATSPPGASARRPAAEVDSLAQLPGTISLPPFRSDFSASQRHEVNPALALNLLKDIQLKVTVWHEQLRKIVQALHALHAQGPMVDGWLESSSETSQIAHSSAAEASILRHGDADALMQYIESLGDKALNPPAQAVNAAGQSLDDACQSRRSGSNSGPNSGMTQYRLCSLDESGQVRSQPCPPEQMGIVSVAIARYQNYKQLLAQKQVIDAKLQLAVDQLTGVRAVLQQED